MLRRVPVRLALVVVALLAVVLLAVNAWTAPQKSQGAMPGLVATYTDGEHRVVLVVPTPNFTLTAEQSIHPQLLPKFRARWKGVLKVLRSGTYEITAADTGGATVYVDGEPVQGRPVSLRAGEHPLRIEYIRAEGTARLQLIWDSDFFVAEPIPSKFLAHRELPPEHGTQAIVERGRELVEELNCIACHQAPAGSTLRGRRGPNLTHVGSRTNAGWIAQWLKNPRHFRPKAVMPVLLDTQERADVAAYLAGLKDPKDEIQPMPTDRFRAKRGKKLFESTGCIACHSEDGVSLGGIGSKMDAGHLAAYLRDPLKVDPSGRMPDMLLNEEEASLIAEHLVHSKNPAFEAKAPKGNPRRGKQLTAARGCVACHTIGDGRPLRNKFKAPPLDQLAGVKGCLAPKPEGRVPRYHFAPGDREAMLAYLKISDISPAPVHEFHRTVKAFSCTACHVLDASPQPDLAELPPPLTGLGAKLRGSRLGAILIKKKRARPWLQLRMPHFGSDNVGHLVEGFVAAAGTEPGEGEWSPPPTPQQVRKGVKLMDSGEGGFACINCHGFPGYEAPGARGPDLTEIYATMRPEWFHRWMRDPLRIQPNTLMPSFFGTKPEAEADQLIHEIWTALATGENMPRPAGIAETGNLTLEVKDGPVVLRTFMPDSAWRSLAVGLPGYLAYCFDAEECMLRYAWVWFGPFLDVNPVWTGRGGREAKVLGKQFYTAPEVFPLRIGKPGREPKRKFRGYAIVEKVSMLRYEVDGVPVRERISPLSKGTGLVRAFEVDSPDQDVWFLAGKAIKGVTYTSPDGAWSGRKLRIPAGSPVRFTVTIAVEEKP